MATLGFVLKRLVAQRLLAVALIVTLGFTIGVLVAGPIYADAAREAILSSDALSAGVTVKNARFRVDGRSGFDFDAADRSIREALRTIPLEQLLRQGRATVRVALPAPRGEEPDGEALSVPVLFRTGAEPNVPVRGEFPGSQDEVALPRSIARQLRAGPGDTIVLSSSGGSVELTVTAIVTPFDATGPYWYGPLSPFPDPDSTQPQPLIVSQEGFLAVAGGLGLTPEYVWDAYIDLLGTPFLEAARFPGRVDRALEEMRAAGGLGSITATTGIDTLLDLVRKRIANLRIPIYLVVFQIGAVALAVLAGVASLALSRQSFELAVLKSRGFTRAKLLGAQTVQTVFTALVAYPIGLLVGMGLARLAIGANGPSPAGVIFPITLSGAAIVAGVIGAVLGGVILVLTSIPFVSRTVVEERRAISREARPLLARYPWEVFVGLLGLAAFWEVRSRGFLPAERSGSIDPLILLAPTLLIFAASFAVLRLLLALFRWMDGFLGRTGSLAAYLAGRRLGRSPGTSFATSLLLVLAAGLLVVSTSYRGIVVQNHEDSARQVVGSDWNVEIASIAQPLAAMDAFPAGTTPIVRTEPSIPIAGGPSPFGLAIDPKTYLDGGWWREDYADVPIETLLDRLATEPAGVPLTDDARSLEVTLDAPEDTAGMRVQAVVRDPEGAVTTLDLGPIEAGSRTYRAVLEGGGRLLDVLFAETADVDAPPIVRLVVERVEVVGGEAEAIDLSSWRMVRWRGSQGDVVALPEGVQLTIDPGTSRVVGGIRPPEPPLPVALSRGLAAGLEDEFSFSVGGQVLEFRRVATLTGFPTLLGEFVVFPAPGLLERARRFPDATLTFSEVWAQGEDPSEELTAAGFLPGHSDNAARIVALLAQLPQSLAVGMHFAAATGGMGLVVVGVAVGLYFSQRRREFEFASLRAMGVDRRQVTAVLLVEQSVLVGFAVAAGFSLGLGILRLMMPYVGKSLGQSFPAPLLVVDWSALGLFGSAIVAATGLGLVLALRALLRSSVTTVLRGEAE
ncbi:MAG: ABC transporter permease [Actinobacteria bacterium]|nr:ABC transporter permease [Actinomycetota bacterium]